MFTSSKFDLNTKKRASGMGQHKKWNSGMFFSREFLVKQTEYCIFALILVDFHCLHAKEIQNEADTWHCASFIAHWLTKENLPKTFLCGPDFMFY